MTPQRSPAAPVTDRRTGKMPARVVTEVLAPANLAGALLVVIAWHSATSTRQALTLSLVALLFVPLIPLIYVLRRVRQGRLSDRHVGIRRQRPVVLGVGVASVVAGFGLLAVLGAPRELLALVVAMVVGLTVSLLITLAWKISIHVAVAAGSVTILVVVFGPGMLVALPVVALVGWARIELRDHTPAQVVAGAVVGALIAGLVFSVTR